MKRTLLPVFLLLAALLLPCPAILSQRITAAGERMLVCTDRTLYAPGETVYFATTVYSTDGISVAPLSRAYYCELVTPGGNRAGGWKFLLNGSIGNGCFTIPEETVTGIYYLKFYTRLMRNAGPGSYAWIMLKIVNPYKSEVLAGTGQPVHAHPDTTGGNLSGGDPPLIRMSKNTFSPREEASLRIEGIKETGASWCLSVIPEGTLGGQVPVIPQIPSQQDNGRFFAETRGISLSGHVSAKGSGNPVAGILVNLSVIGDRDIMVTHSDSAGRFLFALPDHQGNRDIFLSAGDVAGTTSEIFIDNDFCTRPVALPSPQFTLDSGEQQAACRLAVNARVANAFRTDSASADTLHPLHKVPFYGAPAAVLVLDQYIDLPTLSEYFTELQLIVKLRKVDGRKRFRFVDALPEMALYDPLVMIDWVAVDNMDKILAMPPREIERVELVNSLYIKGNATYGGIVSFVSRKNNFAGIDLPTSGTFVNYKFPEKFSAGYPAAASSPSFPDARTTVYWNPSVNVQAASSAGITFNAPDTPGKYQVILRGMQPGGRITMTKTMIEVKPGKN